MRFIHMTDTHVRKNYSQDSLSSVLGQLVDPMKNMESSASGLCWEDMDFVVITGDLVHEGTEEDYRYLREIVEKNIPSSVKVLYVLGNHDRKAEFYKVFDHNNTDTQPFCYTENINGYRLIILDSAVAGKESGTIQDEQLQWLRDVLSEPSLNGTIVFLHHPVFWNGEGEFNMALTNGEEVLNILKASDTFAIFSGHTHVNGVNCKDGISQYTADSLAFSLEIRGKDTLAFTDKIGFEEVEIRGRNIYTHMNSIYQPEKEYLIPLAHFAQQLKKMDE